MIRALTVFGVGLLLSSGLPGCHSTPPPASKGVTEPPSFDRLWTAYTRCVKTSDLESARQQAELLHRAAFPEQDAGTFLPHSLDQYVEKPPTRLAADPHQLAAACGSHLNRIEQAQASR